jgi:hypothetical protein
VKCSSAGVGNSPTLPHQTPSTRPRKRSNGSTVGQAKRARCCFNELEGVIFPRFLPYSAGASALASAYRCHYDVLVCVSRPKLWRSQSALAYPSHHGSDFGRMSGWAENLFPGAYGRRTEPTASILALLDFFLVLFTVVVFALVLFPAVGEVGISQSGPDGKHAPVLDVLHERHFAQALRYPVIVHQHRGIVIADLRDRALPASGVQNHRSGFARWDQGIDRASEGREGCTSPGAVRPPELATSFICNGATECSAAPW